MQFMRNTRVNCWPIIVLRHSIGAPIWSEKEIAIFQQELGKMGYKFQFVTLAGFHSLNAGMFELAQGYKEEGMAAYSRFQQREFDLQKNHGFQAIKHQSFVGVGYFDEIQMVISGGESSTVAFKGSTEEEQFDMLTT